MFHKMLSVLACSCMLQATAMQAQDMQQGWNKEAVNKPHPGLNWFSSAKFGLFIHWGLYSELGGKWKDSSYYGSGEWIMQRAKAPAGEYAKVAASFNPTGFNAAQWAARAKAAGIKYLVITAKHHEGFSMFDSRVTDFDIVDATPYHKDPMKELADACRKEGLQFGFYYSQFLDWHEPDGGGNNWDFKNRKKDYRQYYQSKSIPQLKELLNNYGPLGIIWFDMPGGLSEQETKQMIDSLKAIQPSCLFSSRVGHGLGDYIDFGDSELPPTPIEGAWESIYTHNDSWGYIRHDMNFKSPAEIIRLLSSVASKGGNLMLNVGPDGKGEWPAYSIKYLEETGKWLQQYGESIYGTTHGIIPAQPWGVTTSKPGKVFLHVWQLPDNGQLRVPGLTARINSVNLLGTATALPWKQSADETVITLPAEWPDKRNTVIQVEYSGQQPDWSQLRTQTVSKHYPQANIPAIWAIYNGNAHTKQYTFSHYFGDWKHENCATGMVTPNDAIIFPLEVQDEGDYKVILDYACEPASAGQQGIVTLLGQRLPFLTLATGIQDSHRPMAFIQHPVGIIHIQEPGKQNLTIKPVEGNRQALFQLKQIILEPVK